MINSQIEVALSIIVFFSVVNWFTWLISVYSFPILAVFLYFEVVGINDDNHDD